MVVRRTATTGRDVITVVTLALVMMPCAASARSSRLYDMEQAFSAPHPFDRPPAVETFRNPPLSAPTQAPTAAPVVVPTPSAIPSVGPSDDDILLLGEAPDEPEDDGDFLEPVNRVIFGANDLLFTIFLKPVAKLYQIVVPEFAQDALNNAVDNVSAPVVLANDLMQGEWNRAWETTQRFAVNSTAGLAGTIDVADAWLGIPPHSEDFGQTLAVWGVPEGEYLVLPGLGPSNFRDAAGFAVNGFLDPLNLYLGNINEDAAVYARFGVTGLVEYENVVDDLDNIKETSIDYYATVRSLYRQRRAAEIANDDTADIPDF